MEQVVPDRSKTDFVTPFRSELNTNESSTTGVSWPAVIGGAVVTASLSLTLLALGTGLGLSTVSVWSNVGMSASNLGAVTIVWLILMQVISASMGGYLAGRLRTKWTAIHNDEVYFRDTAHGFLAWAVAFLLTVGFLATAATTMVGAASSGALTGIASQNDPNQYFIDTLFRGTTVNPDSNDLSTRTEVGTMFAKALTEGSLSKTDRAYLTQLIAARTGLSPNDADARASEVFVRTREALETTRKNTAHSLLWAFLALLIGAFCASFAATFGGRHRDNVVATQ
jgi:hypothetical protein